MKSPAARSFNQPFIQTQIKENIKAPRHWPLCGELTGTGEFPAQRASNAENVFIWWRHHDQLIYLEFIILFQFHVSNAIIGLVFLVPSVSVIILAPINGTLVDKNRVR